MVAGEIGKLASNSTESVSNIERLIHEVQALVEDAVEQSRDSSENIKESGQLIGQAVVTFNQIFENIEETSSLIQDMIEKARKWQMMPKPWPQHQKNWGVRSKRSDSRKE